MMAHEFKLMQRILKERSGIEIGEEKMDLVEAKLRPLLKELGFPSQAHLTLALMKRENDGLRSRVAQTIAVLESYFFRDKTPFQYFADVMLPRLMERRAALRRIRIWCAASSTGQEPYSLAMLLSDAGHRLDGWNIEVVATDFSEDALRKARSGLYSQFEVQRGLPVSNLVKYFDKVGNGWQVKPALRDKIAFQEHNLLNDCQRLGRFDIIFCRNVLIYFDERLKSAVLSRLAQQLAMDGYLVLGAAETTSGMSGDFMPVPENHHGIFCLTPDTAAMRRQAKQLHAAPPAAAVTRSAEAVAVSDPSVREVKLHQATAEMLEARARARGMTLAELLTEYAVSEAQAGKDWPNLKAGRD